MTPSEKFESFVQENKLELSYKFVPFSISRNSEEKDKTLNWKVTLKSPKGQMTFEYQKGIGHLPYPQDMFSRRKAYQASEINQILEDAVEKGIARKVTVSNGEITIRMGNADFPNPTMKEILESLSLDADSRHHLSFESWAREYGYDSDSISAQKVYNSCQKIAEQLSKVLGGENKIEQVREIIYEIDNEPQPNKKIKP
jgi:hypothetical protein